MCEHSDLCVFPTPGMGVCVCARVRTQTHRVDKKLGHLEGCNLAEHMNVILRH